MPSRFRRKIIDQAFYDRGCLKEFCEETSLAGFKYLLPQYGPDIRRLMWSCVCLAFTVITIFQLTQQIMGYVNTPLAVDISKDYPDSLNFPAVIICNTMLYRVSRVRPQSAMHRAFSEMYRTPKLNATKALDYKQLLSQYKNTKEYLHEIAFHKHDMIVQCVWKQEESCSADDFDVEIVDSRICYSFNSGRNGTRTIDQAGESNGLEVTLNTETYERMQGPYTTFGAVVAFFPQNHRPTLQGAVNTLIGASTKIGLRQKQIKYYKGQTCDDRELKYYAPYSRNSCILEKKIEAVTQKCRCLPFIVNNTKAFGNYSTCSLFEHFHCSYHKLGETPTVGPDECPKDCDVISYESSVSQSFIAWDQAQSTLTGKYSQGTRAYSTAASGRNEPAIAAYSDTARLDEKLLNATEIRHRFDPNNNRTSNEFFAAFSEATANVTNLMMDINNMTCYEDLVIPAGGAVPAISENFDLVDSYIISGDNSLVNLVSEKLIKLNESVHDILFLFGNETFLDYIVSSNNVSEADTLENLNLPAEYFTLSNGYVYLNTLKKWAEAIGGIKESQREFNKSMSSLSKTWRYIMNKNDSMSFNQTLNKLLTVGFQQGCLDVAYQEEEIDENTTRIDYLIDIVSCFHHYHSSENMKQTQSLLMVEFVTLFTENHAEVDLQTTLCSKLLCRIIEESDDHNCTLDPQKLEEIIPDLANRLDEVISNCSENLEQAKNDIEEFLVNYRNSTYPEFNDLAQKVSSYKMEAESVRLRLCDPIWPVHSSLGLILGNISAFIHDGVTFKSLSENITNVYSEYLQNTFSFAANEARSRLQVLAESLAKLDNYTEDFYASMDSFTTEETMEGYSMFQILANNLLWQNMTLDGLSGVSECASTIRNLTAEYLNRLPSVQTSYTQHGGEFITMSQDYLNDLKIDNSFFNKNFMVVNIYFQEISNDVTIQRSSYNFWSLMADIGGASGLWLGFCMVTLVEFAEMFIRHVFGSAVNFVGRRNQPKNIGTVESSDDIQMRGASIIHQRNGDPRTRDKQNGVGDYDLQSVFDRSNLAERTNRTKL